MKSNTSLNFSCYRIRRNFSLPLPIQHMPILANCVRGFDDNYPWQIWALWALEERILSLFLQVVTSDSEDVLKLLERDLMALASWPQFHVHNKPDLPFAHATLVLATAKHSCFFLSEHCQTQVNAGLLSAVEQGLSLFGNTLFIQQSCDILTASKPHQHLHNIPLIAMAALAMAAEVINHKDAGSISNCLLAHVLARFELTNTGFTEGVSYDGYWLNFVLAWLETQPVKLQQSLITHSAITLFEQQILAHACPGHLASSAELGDVEPEQMTFLWSALARLQKFQFSPARAFLLSQVPQTWLRADAKCVLQNLHLQKTNYAAFTAATPHVSPLLSNTCISLNSGLACGDLSVVIAVSNSPMGHIQTDNGTLVIGKQKRWWITDPGYQQYLKTSERVFTIGKQAHNYPVVNGCSQNFKSLELINYGKCAKFANCDFVVLELTDCYSRAAAVDNVTRTLWRIGKNHVLLCDTVITETTSQSVDYSWHGHADAYWGELSNAVYSVFDDTQDRLFIQTSIGSLSLGHVQRLRGSRGSMTLCTHSQLNQHKVQRYWWLFSFADTLPVLEVGDLSASIDGELFNLHDTLPMQVSQPKLKVLILPEGIQAQIRAGDEFVTVTTDEQWLLNLLEDGQLIQQIESNRRKVLFNYYPIKAASRLMITATRISHQQLEVRYELQPIEIVQIRQKPLVTTATLHEDKFSAFCVLMPDFIDDEVEYAFYFMVNGEKFSVVWYSDNNMVTFDCSGIEAGMKLEIKGFVRAKRDTSKKFSSTSLSFTKPRET